MNKSNKSTSDTVALFFRAVTAGASRLPRSWLDFLVGTVVLRWLFLGAGRHRRTIARNYGRIIKDAPPERLRGVVDESVALYARFLVSMLGRPEDLDFARERTDLSELLPTLAEARKAGRGAIIAFSNFGLFSYVVIQLLQRREPLCIPVLNPGYFKHLIPEWAAAFVPVGGASRRCLEALARNETVCVVTMGNYLPKRPAFSFFGAPARLGYAPARLAVSSKAPILPAFTVFENGRCRVEVPEVLVPESGEKAVERLTERLARLQEKAIARRPEQWLVYEDFWDLEAMDANYRLVRWIIG